MRVYARALPTHTDVNLPFPLLLLSRCAAAFFPAACAHAPHCRTCCYTAHLQRTPRFLFARLLPRAAHQPVRSATGCTGAGADRTFSRYLPALPPAFRQWTYGCCCAAPAAHWWTLEPTYLTRATAARTRCATPCAPLPCPPAYIPFTSLCADVALPDGLASYPTSPILPPACHYLAYFRPNLLIL